MVNEFGYAGKILKVDLSRGITVDTATTDYADRFVGGRGIGAKIYWDEVSPKVKALDPENRLIFAIGPLAGFSGLAGSRFQVCGKSPAITPESFSYANLGGSWGAWLKFAGYDALIIQGKSDKPVYLLIQDGKTEIRDASFLWGKGAIEIREIIKARLGADIRVAAIGPAGDNMAVMANVIADDDASGSGGFGAVMGSKNLKAIAVGANERKVMAANPEKLKELVKYGRSLKKDSRFIFSGPHRMWSSYVPENLKSNPKLKRSACCWYECLERPIAVFHGLSIDGNQPSCFSWYQRNVECIQWPRESLASCLEIGLFARPAVVKCLPLLSLRERLEGLVFAR